MHATTGRNCATPRGNVGEGGVGAERPGRRCDEAASSDIERKWASPSAFGGPINARGRCGVTPASDPRSAGRPGPSVRGGRRHCRLRKFVCELVGEGLVAAQAGRA